MRTMLLAILLRCQHIISKLKEAWNWRMYMVLLFGPPTLLASSSGTVFNISEVGNLMLCESKDNAIWQSFDYPTDTWLPNQNISFLKGLTSCNSSSNLGTGLYSLTMGPNNSLVAFVNSNPPQNSSDCDYPAVCGNYRGGSGNGLCNNCHGANTSYFTLDWQPNLGCKPVTSLSCENRQQHSFLEHNNVTYLNLEPWHSEMDRESCKKACLDNCTCKAAFYSSGQSSSPPFPLAE
ncbi:hypothetical protein LguiB_002825 [Lonicera macranthoides]